MFSKPLFLLVWRGGQAVKGSLLEIYILIHRLKLVSGKEPYWVFKTTEISCNSCMDLVEAEKLGEKKNEGAA